MIPDTIKRYWIFRYGDIRFRLMDITCLIYMALIGFLLIFFHKTVTYWPLYVFIHTAIFIGILEIVRLGEKYPQKKILLIFRTFYPIPLLLYAWEELDVLVPMFFGTHWATDVIARWDKLIFGVHPIIWVQQFYQPWLDELMNFFYTGYYTFFLIVPLSLFVCKKKQEALAVFSLATVAYFSNFLLFYFLPAIGPLYLPEFQALQVKQQTGYLFAEINRIVQAKGGIPVGTFPSSHVGGALVWVLSAFRYNRKLGYALAPLALGMGFSVVYRGLHYAVDSISGYSWGVLCYLIALKLIKKRGEDPLTISEKSGKP